MPETTRPELSVTLAADWMSARLRADDIIKNLLISLAEAWTASDGAVMDALDALAEALQGDPSPKELDALVQALEGVTDGEEYARLDLADAERLRAELDKAIPKLARFGPSPSPAFVRPALKVVTT
ncbi:hypothetical protein [Streptomyces iconiensis]|uniref:Uncharacterized protein n=1 Tax=Streptomyces iconiensis TaxID=1384038 RepID=A0ABT6ZTQ5_9ACTN|nr:hypothetical protein [Streptomyces iconiensis]MDJ1132439.1 hypothetical protein [Streptomyces iconiensis]